MGHKSKKGKGKDRLDKYYYLAKEQGFRSRAAFKLIQLNRKYNFLNNAVCLIDLCAAPGGWLQVASKYMPSNSIKLGVDLDAIKPIKGCDTSKMDITTPECYTWLRTKMQTFKADVVLHDGAPNVGAAWSKDAYTQAELVLHAMKLAVNFLKPGGLFITKVFRSKDYPSLIKLANIFFNKVDTTKPQASRSQSAEAFIICIGFKSSKNIDFTLFDPKKALAEIEDDLREIKSLNQLMANKRVTGGYDNTAKGLAYQKSSLIEFINSANPYQFVSDNAEIKMDEESKKLVDICPPPKDYQDLVKDLKVLSKSEITHLLKWRSNIRNEIKKKERKAEKELFEKNKETEKETEKGKEEKEEEKEEEIAEETNINKEPNEEGDYKKLTKKEKKVRDRAKKRLANLKASEFAGETVDDDQLNFDDEAEVGEELDIENMSYESANGEDDEHEFSGPKQKEVDINDMDEELEMEHLRSKEDQLNRHFKNVHKSDIQSVSTQLLGMDEPDMETNSKISRVVSNKISSILKDSKTSDRYNRQAPKEAVEEPESSDIDDEKYGIKKVKSERDKRKERLKRQREAYQGRVNPTKKYGFEEVPMENNNEEEKEYDSDDIAETVAIAKKMLRKKKKTEIMNSSINRYAFEDTETMPSWFKDDESKHAKPQLPVTKEEVMAEKERMKIVSAPKKELEAMGRKKRRIMKKMDKVKAKANAISSQADMTEQAKSRQIEKMYKKEMRELKPKKKYVVSKRFQTLHSKVKSRRIKGVKMVDSRMKKETNAKIRRMRKGYKK